MGLVALGDLQRRIRARHVRKAAKVQPIGKAVAAGGKALVAALPDPHPIVGGQGFRQRLVETEALAAAAANASCMIDHTARDILSAGARTDGKASPE